MFKIFAWILFCFNCFVFTASAESNGNHNLIRNIIQNSYNNEQEKSTKDPLVLITGCGRSGTTYTTNLLRACGLDVKHEKIGIDGSVSWFMAVDSDFPWGSGDTHFRHTFHQIRDPIDVITSFYVNIDHVAWVWNYVYNYIPEIKREDPHLVKCAKYWYYWNLKAEEKSEWSYRIEDIEEVFEEMSFRLGVSLDKNALNIVPKNTNSWQSTEKKITWGDLRKVLNVKDFNNIRNLAIKYGYGCPVID